MLQEDNKHLVLVFEDLANITSKPGKHNPSYKGVLKTKHFFIPPYNH